MNLVLKEKIRNCSKGIEINCLLALCEMENYDMFCKELETLITSDKNKGLIYKMYGLMQGKIILGNKKYKEFVKKYKNTIEIMKKYYCLSEMTIYKYNPDGTINNRSTIDYFYKYIQDHREDVENIKSIAIKIKKLGFSTIIYDEKIDFTDIEYELDKSYGSDFEYLENIEVIPTYSKDKIKYKSNSSCYCMIIDTLRHGNNKRISDFFREIVLNSLLFDPNRLPNEITTESTIGVLKRMSEDKKTDYQIIGDAVNMSVYTDDLMKQYSYIKSKIESIEKVKNREDVKQILCNITKELNQLKLVSITFEKELINNSDGIDKEKIEIEKKLYLKRRDSY